MMRTCKGPVVPHLEQAWVYEAVLGRAGVGHICESGMGLVNSLPAPHGGGSQLSVVSLWAAEGRVSLRP